MAYGCHDTAIILRQPKFKKSQSINTFHNQCKKVFEPMFVLKRKEKDKVLNVLNHIMKFEAYGKAHFVYVTTLFFGVISHLYPKEQE